MNTEFPVYLKDRRTGDLVEATLVEEMTKELVTRTQGEWRPFIEALRDSLRRRRIPWTDWPEHMHWDWETKAAVYEVWAIERGEANRPKSPKSFG